MNAKKIILITLVLALFAGAGVFAYTTYVQEEIIEEAAVHTEDSVSEEFKLYENQEYGFSFSYPNDWTIQESTASISLLSPKAQEDIVNRGTTPADITFHIFSSPEYLDYVESSDILNDLSESPVTELQYENGVYSFIQKNEFLDEDQYTFYAELQNSYYLSYSYILSSNEKANIEKIINSIQFDTNFAYKKAPEGWLTYENSEYNFSFYYPQDWNLDVHEDGGYNLSENDVTISNKDDSCYVHFDYPEHREDYINAKETSILSVNNVEVSSLVINEFEAFSYQGAVNSSGEQGNIYRIFFTDQDSSSLFLRHGNNDGSCVKVLEEILHSVKKSSNIDSKWNKYEVYRDGYTIQYPDDWFVQYSVLEDAVFLYPKEIIGDNDRVRNEHTYIEIIESGVDQDIQEWYVAYAESKSWDIEEGLYTESEEQNELLYISTDSKTPSYLKQQDTIFRIDSKSSEYEIVNKAISSIKLDKSLSSWNFYSNKYLDYSLYYPEDWTYEIVDLQIAHFTNSNGNLIVISPEGISGGHAPFDSEISEIEVNAKRVKKIEGDNWLSYSFYSEDDPDYIDFIVSAKNWELTDQDRKDIEQLAHSISFLPTPTVYPWKKYENEEYNFSFYYPSYLDSIEIDTNTINGEAVSAYRFSSTDFEHIGVSIFPVGHFDRGNPMKYDEEKGEFVKNHEDSSLVVDGMEAIQYAYLEDNYTIVSFTDYPENSDTHFRIEISAPEDRHQELLQGIKDTLDLKNVNE